MAISLAASIIRAHSLDANGASPIRRACFLVAGGIIRALIAARPGLAPLKELAPKRVPAAVE